MRIAPELKTKKFWKVYAVALLVVMGFGFLLGSFLENQIYRAGHGIAHAYTGEYTQSFK